jgi:hypothetical protein
VLAEATPVTTPEDDPTLAILLSALAQVPPVYVSVSVVDAPAHTDGVPDMATLGDAVTVVVV